MLERAFYLVFNGKFTIFSSGLNKDSLPDMHLLRITSISVPFSLKGKKGGKEQEKRTKD